MHPTCPGVQPVVPVESACPVLDPPVLPVPVSDPDPLDPPVVSVSSSPPTVVPRLLVDAAPEVPEDQLSPELSGGPIGSTEPHPASTTNMGTHRIARDRSSIIAP